MSYTPQNYYDFLKSTGKDNAQVLEHLTLPDVNKQYSAEFLDEVRSLIPRKKTKKLGDDKDKTEESATNPPHHVQTKIEENKRISLKES